MTQQQTDENQIVAPDNVGNNEDANQVTNNQQVAPAPNDEDATQTDDGSQDDPDSQTADGDDATQDPQVKPDSQAAEDSLEAKYKKLENDLKAERGRNQAYLRQQEFDKKVNTVVQDSFDETKWTDAAAKLATDKELFEAAKAYIPDLQPLTQEQFIQRIQAANIEQKTVIESKQQLNKIQEQAKSDIEIERVKARFQAALEYTVPAYGQVARSNTQIAQVEFEAAMQSALVKAKYIQATGRDVPDSLLQEMVANELVSLNPTYKARQPATNAGKDISKMLNGAATNTPTNAVTKLTPNDQALYDEIYQGLIEQGIDAKKAAQQAQHIINT